MTPSAAEWLTVRAAAKEAACTPKTIRRHIEKGALPVVRIGPFRRIRIRRDDFDRYLKCSP